MRLDGTPRPLCTIAEEVEMTSELKIKAVIHPGEQSGFVAECVDIPVVTQGATLKAAFANLCEAVALHLPKAKI